MLPRSARFVVCIERHFLSAELAPAFLFLGIARLKARRPNWCTTLSQKHTPFFILFYV